MGRSPSGVEPLDRAERVRHQVAVDDVGDLVGRDVAGVALGGDVVHLHLEAHRHELDQHAVVDVLRVHAVQRRHEVRQRPDDPQRVAVGDHDACIGVGGEEQGQGGKVRGRLDDPARRRSLGHPLQRLQVALVPVVDRRLVLAAAPHRVLGHVVEARVDVARELVGEGEDALGGQPAAVLVHGGEGGDDLVHQPDLVVAQVARRIVVGDGVQQLPQQRRAVVRVAGQQLVQQRGARAPEAGHDDGGVHGLLQDGRLLLPEVDHAQAVLQDQLELAAGADAARQVEARLGVERGAEAAEGLLPPVVAEVVEPGGGDGGGLQDLGVQRHHRAPVVAEAVSERDHLVRPGAARWGGPGHGASPYPQRGRMVAWGRAAAPDSRRSSR